MQTPMQNSTEETMLAVLGVMVLVAFVGVKEWSFHKLPYDHWLNEMLNPRNPPRDNGTAANTSGNASDDGGGCD